MDLNLRGKVAVVAASSAGIGRATAEAFAREDTRVVINGRHQDTLLKTRDELVATTGAEVETVIADLATRAGCERLIVRAVERFGSLDVLVTNSGGPPAMPFMEATDEDWRVAIDLVLMSAVRLMRAAIPHLRESRGSIVNITSISVKQPVPALVLSNSIRPGVVGLGKTLASELAPYGVRVNDVAPGSIWTGRQQYLTAARAETAGMALEDAVRETETTIPLARYGTAEEVANLVVFLSSGAASYITGTTVLVDGAAFRGLM